MQVNYETSVQIERIDVYETYNGGGVVKVSAQETDTNNWHLLWSVPQPTDVATSRIFSPTLNVSIDKVSNCTRLIAWTKCLHAYSAKYL